MSKMTKLLRNTARRVMLRFAKRKIDRATVELGDASIYSHGRPTDCKLLDYPNATHSGESQKLTSCLCTGEQLASDAFGYWSGAMNKQVVMHRKLWEYCYVLQALNERGMLAEGRRGLGFAVGEEPLPSLMAEMGCTILASDLDCSDERAEVWSQTAQLASSLEGLNKFGLCDPKKFNERVAFRSIDMNRIPSEVCEFDFTWSSCSFEHCGSIELGKRFILEQMKCLKPGGVAVHTTEFNLSSLDDTVEQGSTVIFRRKDIESIVRELQADGHEVEPLQLDLGKRAEDRQVAVYPYDTNPHLKLELFDQYVSTSIGLIIRKASNAATGLKRDAA